MPQLLQHIDAIARDKERDVLFVHFEHYDHHDEDAEANQTRQQLMQWLDAHGMSYQPCMGLEQEGLISGYAGDLYIDVPFEEGDATYQLLRTHLEHENGDMRIPGVLFFCLSLEIALEIEEDRLSWASWDEEDEIEDLDDIDPQFDSIDMDGSNRPS